MSIGTLYYSDYMPATKLIKAVAGYSGLTLDLAKDYVHMQDNKKPEYLAKFASGKVPAFEGSDGFTLFETKAIARYIAGLNPKAGLLGSTSKDAALVDQWVSFIDAEVASKFYTAMNVTRARHFPYSKPIDTWYRAEGVRHTDILEKWLTTHTFLVGERITLADLTLAATLSAGLGYLLDAEWRKAHPAVLRLYETVVNQPSLKSAYGETQYIDKAVQYTPPPKEAKEAKAPAPAAAPKEAKPKPKKEAEPEEDDDDGIPRDEPKAKNPLDSLPKSDFNLEEWKRTYSNLDTRGAGGSVEWLYSKFDKAGFSIWRVDFKYNDELTQVFMSSNQIGGFFNRLEASRKYLFGSVGVLGTANNSVISGVFIARGPDINPVVEVAPDYESYDYKKLDIDNADDKKFLEGALAWDLEIDGKKWADGKAFK